MSGSIIRDVFFLNKNIYKKNILCILNKILNITYITLLDNTKLASTLMDILSIRQGPSGSTSIKTEYKDFLQPFHREIMKNLLSRGFPRPIWPIKYPRKRGCKKFNSLLEYTVFHSYRLKNPLKLFFSVSINKIAGMIWYDLIKHTKLKVGLISKGGKKLKGFYRE